MTSNIDISIIIVNYKTPQLLYNCIGSIEKNITALKIEIIVVDNDSQDGSENLIKINYPNVLWINMGYNSGFARANNAGIHIAKGEYILLLNSDTVIINDCLVESLDYYKNLEKQNIKVGLLGCKMKDLNEQVLFNSNNYFPGLKKIIISNPVYIWFNRKKQGSSENNIAERIRIHCTNHESAWIGFAFAICKRRIIEDEKFYLDEDFFMYGEDVELCYRMAKKGYKHFFFSEAEIYHVNCGSSVSGGWRSSQITVSEWMYIYKTRGYLYFKFYIGMINLNLFMDKVLYLISASYKKKNGEEREILKNDQQHLKMLVRQYARRIYKEYKVIPSSSKTFLKYNV